VPRFGAGEDFGKLGNQRERLEFVLDALRRCEGERAAAMAEVASEAGLSATEVPSFRPCSIFVHSDTAAKNEQMRDRLDSAYSVRGFASSTPLSERDLLRSLQELSAP